MCTETQSRNQRRVEAEQKGCYQARLRRRTGAHLALELIASCAHRLHLLEDKATSLLLVSCTDRCSGQGGTATFLLRFLRALAQQGLSQAAIARHLGLWRTSVRWVLAKQEDR